MSSDLRSSASVKEINRDTERENERERERERQRESLMYVLLFCQYKLIQYNNDDAVISTATNYDPIIDECIAFTD